MDRKVFLTSSLIIGGLLGLFWMIGGCSGKIPAIGTVLAPTTPLSSNYISNFENNKPTLNPFLLGGASNNIWRDATFGGPNNTVNNPIVVPNTVPDSVDNSLYAIHVFASLTAGGVGCGYESDQLVCPLYHGDTNTYFDASSFTGIQFLINIAGGPSGDTNTNPVFQVVVAETEPPPALDGTAGGTCVQGPCGSSCFNHFQYSLSGITKGAGWQPVSVTWSAFGSPFNAPPQPLSYYLKHFIFLQWTFSDNVPSGVTTNTDFWVDNVQFLP